MAIMKKFTEELRRKGIKKKRWRIKMMESLKGKLTEEEAREYIRKQVNCNNFEISYDIRCKVNNYYFDLLKENGYIKQNPVERAKDDWDKISEEYKITPYTDLYIICTANNYISELKKQLEEK